MLKEKEAEVNVYGTDASEVETLKVTDINACDEEDDFGSFKIKYPYEITIEDSKGNVVLKEKTQKALRTKDWNKKFYVKSSDSGNDFTAYTRYMSLLALATIKTAKTNESLPPKINLNNFVGFEFEGVVVRLDGRDPFIDWVGTFETNGVSVPAPEELMERTSGTFSEPKPEAESAQPKEAPKKGGAW